MSEATSEEGSTKVEGEARKSAMEVALTDKQLNALTDYGERLKGDHDKLLSNTTGLVTTVGKAALESALKRIGNMEGPVDVITSTLSEPDGRYGFYDPESKLMQADLRKLEEENHLTELLSGMNRFDLAQVFRVLEMPEPEDFHPKYVKGVPVVFSRDIPAASV
jgi:hypothetical protein